MGSNNQKHIAMTKAEITTEIAKSTGIDKSCVNGGNVIPAFSDRYLRPITTPEAQEHYYDGVDSVRSRFKAVCDGEKMGIVSVGDHPVAMTDFRFSNIIGERMNGGLFFVQDADNGKWGAYCMTFSRVNRHEGRRSLDSKIVGLKEILPTIADEIFETDLYTDCSPTFFWVARQGDKIGIITRWNATDIIYNSFSGNEDDTMVALFQNGIFAKAITSF